jgi:hypothetical protein
MSREDKVVGSDQITQLANGFRGAKALMSAVELGVFSALAGGPLHLDALRVRIGLHPRGARDFMDALVALGLLARDAAGCYSNTPAADLYLVQDSPTYVGGLFDHLSTHEYPHWHRLTQALQTGEAQFGSDTTGLYPALYAQDSHVERFASAMSGATVLVGKQLAVAFPWERYRTVIDIGTAEGCLLAQIALSHPHVTGGGFDLPSLQLHFERYIRRHGLSERLRFYPGDFLSDRLPSADVLVLGRVLHNWDLPTKRILLAKAYEAVAPGGVLIVYERFIEDDRQSNAAGLLASLNMLVMTSGGSEVTAAHCIDLLEESGFRDMQTEMLGGDQRMVIGTKP